jgi:hypothetical protein
MSAVMSTLSPEYCATCVENGLKVIKLKHINALTIGFCILLSFGGISFSTYILFKYLKLKRSISSLETRLTVLNNQLNILNDSDIDDLGESSSSDSDDDHDDCCFNNHQQQEEEIAVEQLQRQSRSSTTVKSILSNSSSSGSGTTRRKVIQQVSRRDGNNASTLTTTTDSEFYETPSSSPTRLYDMRRTISFSDQNREISKETLDDNKTLDFILRETYDGRKKICSKNELLYEKDPNSLFSCIEFIKSLYVLAEGESDSNRRKELRFKAYNLSKRANELNQHSYLAKKWYAITISIVIDYLSSNEKIKFGLECKNQLDEAIQLNDTDYLLFYLRGRWSWKMANLSWAEKYGIRLIYGQTPAVSVDDAFRDFLKAEELNGGKSKGNLLYLAKCYIQKFQTEKAVTLMKKAIELPNRTSEHLKCHDELLALLKKHSSSIL